MAAIVAAVSSSRSAGGVPLAKPRSRVPRSTRSALVPRAAARSIAPSSARCIRPGGVVDPRITRMSMGFVSSGKFVLLDVDLRIGAAVEEQWFGSRLAVLKVVGESDDDLVVAGRVDRLDLAGDRRQRARQHRDPEVVLVELDLVGTYGVALAGEAVGMLALLGGKDVDREAPFGADRGQRLRTARQAGEQERRVERDR